MLLKWPLLALAGSTFGAECTDGEKAACDSNATCTKGDEADAVAVCACNQNFRDISDDKDGSKCECELFTVECSTSDGFLITAHASCLASDYSAIPDNSGFYIYGMEDPLKKEDEPTGGLTTLEAPCIFADGTATVGFSECGSTQFEQGDDYNVMSTYVHHRTDFAGTEISTMAPYKLECQLDHVDLADDGPSIGIDHDHGAQAAETNIPGEQLISDFGLGLHAGTYKNDVFSQFSAETKLAVGDTVSIILVKKDGITDFNFALRDCKAVVSTTDIPLYDEYCPNESSRAVGVKAESLEHFQVNIFRVGNSDSLTFACNVAIFPASETLPDVSKCGEVVGGDDAGNVDNNVSGRRRRETIIGQAIMHVQKRSDGGDPMAIAPISVTLELEDEVQSDTSTTCANLFLSAISLAYLY